MEWFDLATLQELIVGLDGQYIFITIIGIFALSVIISPGPIIKTLLATLLITGLVIPITRQFLLPALPVVTWAVLFYSARYYLFLIPVLIIALYQRNGAPIFPYEYCRPWRVFYMVRIYPTSCQNTHHPSSMFLHGSPTASFISVRQSFAQVYCSCLHRPDHYRSLLEVLGT